MTLTLAQIARLDSTTGTWAVTSTVRSAHYLAAAVANDDFHGALSNIIRSAGARIWENLDDVRADDVDRFAAHVEGSNRYGTDAADRARIVAELRAIADYMREYGDDDMVDDDVRCVVCGEPIDYCAGHGEIGDPFGAEVLAAHYDGDHNNCHPLGCDETPVPAVGASVYVTSPASAFFHGTVTAVDAERRTVDVLPSHGYATISIRFAVRDVVEMTK